jgi:hypothetical protein
LRNGIAAVDNAPITTGERLEWLASHCAVFQFQLNKTGFFITARMCNERYYESAGGLDDFHEAIDDAFYECLQR